MRFEWRSGWFFAVAALVTVFAVFLAEYEQQANALPPDEDPVLLVENITAAPPASGSNVSVNVPANGFETDTADNNTTIELRNITRDGLWTTPSSWNTAGKSFMVKGAAGDTIEIRATNTPPVPASPRIDTAELDDVPEQPLDLAPPDYVLGPANITSTLAGGVFTVTGTPGDILDNSFPATVELMKEGVPSSTTSATVQGNATMSTQGFSLNMSGISTGQRMVVTFIDDYGNRTELHYYAGLTVSSVSGGFYPSSYPSSLQADSERTGNAPVVATGILGVSGEFVASRVVHSLRGAKLPVTFALSYRSGCTYNGPVGRSWDWNLDSRLQSVSGSYYWYPGDGSRHGPFTYAGSGTWAAPSGVFRKLSAVSGELVLEDVAANKLIFEPGSGLLKRIEDAYGNKVTLTRDASSRVIIVKDDLGRLTRLGWFESGHLAAIDDFGGRRVLLDVSTSGNLERVTRPGETWSISNAKDWIYSGFLMTEMKDNSGRSILKNTYTSSKVTSQRNRHNINAPASAISISYGTGTVTVTDAAGAVTLHHHRTVQPFELQAVEQRSNLNLRASGSGFPGSDDPYAWKTKFTINTSNLLRATLSYETKATSGSAWVPTGDDESWTYRSPTHSDARLRARLANHKVNPGASELVESWTHGVGGADFFPSAYMDFDGIVTNYTYDSSGSGAVETTKIANVSVPSGKDSPYDIETKTEYDGLGRVSKTYTPNRMDSGASPEPSVEYTYYATGPQEGYLKKVSHKNTSGAVRGWAEFEYDLYGNVTKTITPRSATETNESTTEYDDLDRATKVRGPDVTLTGSASNVVYDEFEYEYSGDDVAKVWRKYWTEDGAAGTGTHGSSTTPTRVLVEENSYDSAGRVTSQKRDLAYDASAGSNVQSEFTTEYDDLGNVSLEKQKVDATNWIEVEYEYDSRQLILRTIRNAGGAGAPNLNTWYKYDHREREIERYGPKWTTPAVTTYDDYGRRDATRTTKVDLGKDDLGSDLYGYFETATEFESGKYRAIATVTRYYETYPGAPTEVARSEYAYDAAGRPHRTGTLIEDASPDRYSYSNVDLYPGGQAKRQFSESESQADYDAYVLTILDDLNRVAETRDCYDTSTDQPYRTRTVFVHDDDTGRIASTTEHAYDEVAVDWIDYQMASTYDELGRMTRRHNKGANGGGDVFEVRVFGGMGHLYETWNEKGTSSPAKGMTTRTTHDFAGRRTQRLRGYAFGSADVYEHVEWEYDCADRVLRKSMLDLRTTVNKEHVVAT